MMRFILAESFDSTESELITNFRTMHFKCLKLFESILSSFERRIEFNSIIILIKLILKHLLFTVLHQFSSTKVDVLELSTRLNKASIAIERMMRLTYSADYEMKDIHELSRIFITWCKRLSFTDRFVSSHIQLYFLFRVILDAN